MSVLSCRIAQSGLLWLLSFSTLARGETFDYAVYVGSTRAGEAKITVASDGVRYWVDGVLRSSGVLDLLTAWRGAFRSEGEISGGYPVLTGYEFREQDRRNVRYVTIHDGVLTQVKNGRVRPPRAAPEHADLLSTFLLPGGCLAQTSLHLAKTSYALDLQSTRGDVIDRSARSVYEGAALQCRYEMQERLQDGVQD
ncbi:MAG: DUF3108 domain-containing protein, partial [Gammaproteobacteria bacterium]|nr:DUF3108 domain-containing protein [Gammaproteobacteria bacterium]